MVEAEKNGSMQAVAGSGISSMSDSLMDFQPAIDEPSNMVPSWKISSSMRETSKVTCCHLPRGSVNRKSTYLTSLSLISFRTSIAVLAIPGSLLYLGIQPWFDRGRARARGVMRGHKVKVKRRESSALMRPDAEAVAVHTELPPRFRGG